MWAKQIPSIHIRFGDVIINGVKLGYCWWSRCKFWSVTFVEVIWVTRGHQQIFANNSRLKRASGMGVVSLCWSCHDACTDIQHDLRCSACDLTWGQILTWPFKATTYMFRRALTRETRRCPKYAASLLVQKLFAKNAKTVCLMFLWPLTPKPFTLAQIWRHAGERTVLRAIECYSRPPT